MPTQPWYLAKETYILNHRAGVEEYHCSEEDRGNNDDAALLKGRHSSVRGARAARRACFGCIRVSNELRSKKIMVPTGPWSADIRTVVESSDGQWRSRVRPRSAENDELDGSD